MHFLKLYLICRNITNVFRWAVTSADHLLHLSLSVHPSFRPNRCGIELSERLSLIGTIVSKLALLADKLSQKGRKHNYKIIFYQSFQFPISTKRYAFDSFQYCVCVRNNRVIKYIFCPPKELFLRHKEYFCDVNE